ncbi:anthrone oxygenase family protein [Auraticoccus monumenti]
MSRAAPPLFLSATATAAGAALVALGRHDVPLATGRALAAACVAAAVAVTLVVNEPMNTRLRAWDPDDAPPADWRAVREQWDRGHRRRRALLAAAAVASGWGTVRSRTDSRSLPHR